MTVLTKLEYLRRFTQEERVAIREAAKSSAVLEDYLALLELAESIDTEDVDTVAAVTMLEGAGLLSAGRATEILGTPDVPSAVVSLPAVVYKLGDNYMTCYEGESPPEHFDNQWSISALLGEMIKAGAAEIRIIGDELEVFQRVI